MNYQNHKQDHYYVQIVNSLINARNYQSAFAEVQNISDYSARLECLQSLISALINARNYQYAHSIINTLQDQSILLHWQQTIIARLINARNYQYAEAIVGEVANHTTRLYWQEQLVAALINARNYQYAHSVINSIGDVGIRLRWQQSLVDALINSRNYNYAAIITSEMPHHLILPANSAPIVPVVTGTHLRPHIDRPRRAIGAQSGKRKVQLPSSTTVPSAPDKVVQPTLTAQSFFLFFQKIRWKFFPSVSERRITELEKIENALSELKEKIKQQSGRVEKQRSKVKENEREEQILAAQVQQYLEIGERTKALRVILDLEHKRKLLKANRVQLQEAERLSTEIQKLHQVYADEARRHEESIRDLLNQKETSQGQVALAQAANNQLKKADTIRGRLDTLREKLDSEVEEAQLQAVNKTEILIDVNYASSLQQQANYAEILLKEFEKKRNLSG